jgi:hypothetical protein
MRRFIALALLLGVLHACARDDGAGLSTDRFVDVIVELRRAAEETRATPADFTARRDQILRDASVTEEELRAYVERHGRDVAHMATVWETVNRRLADLPDDPDLQ